ncbi:MAG: leucyl aminopeptidase [Halothiobacillaceae bacterium]|nr:MAG: leucyl aminopeptidase [Halothiobacillaceae bacterium]
MEYGIKSGSANSLRSACIVVGVHEGRKLTPSAQVLDEASGGQISQILKRGDLEGKCGQTLLLPILPGITAERVLLVGLGHARELDLKGWKKAHAEAAGALAERGAGDAAFCLLEAAPRGMEADEALRLAVLAIDERSYRFDPFLRDKKPPQPALKRVNFVTGRKDMHDLEEALRAAEAIASGIRLTKDLANMPGNVCTPSYLADEARRLASLYPSIHAEILDQSAMEHLGMGALLAVAKGSVQPPRFIAMEYRQGPEGGKPVVLVGKGVTFDSGGISLKPGEKMDEMKYDMSGAATVLGVFAACAEMRLAVNLVGLIPTVENMPSGGAAKPGDIVTSMSGQTIEILNTDAEGRLILCDALTYAERYKPEAVIDMATLTGACVVALARVPSGLLGNHRPLVQSLLKAGEKSGDRAWELPLWDDYQDLLKSNFADMANIGGREGGAITAASFLARFTKAYHWAHLDIAGTAWNSGDKKGATGRPVPLVMTWLMDRATQSL